MRRLLAVLIALTIAIPAVAQDFKMEPAAKSPEDSLKCIKPRPGFKVELMVAEPLVKSPIAFAWGPDGKFWVVEMGDYPLGVDGKGKPGGKIKFLEKSKPDGPYDKMTVFMDGLGFPTGVFPYGKGILVTCAPDIFYAELGKDGKVKKEVLFTGFKEGNQQHRVNGLSWGIDNWIYGANGDSGGQIQGAKSTGLLPRKVKEGIVDIRGRDFRFKPDTGEFETVSGQSQFGRCRDDWGNWFGCNNSNPMYHYVLDDNYLKRNPNVLYPDPKVNVSVKPGAAEVFPISKPLPRFNNPQALNHFTSACSTIIYRDTLFGKEFEGNMFVSEPVHNLIHREIMKPKGVTFTSQRADDEQTSEFLASSDNWFRPTMIQIGPDGALWIADMYRYVIEHPEWIPKDWQKKLDLRAGENMGRIYRVYPADKKPREIVRLDGMKPKELVKQLESPSGAVRDMAHQLLLKKFETADQASALEEMAKKSKSPQARLHAIFAQDQLRGWRFGEIRELLADPHTEIRKNCIALLEGFSLRGEPELIDALEKNENEPVRLQVAYLLNGSGAAGLEPRLAKFLFANTENRYLLAAALSSVSKKNWPITFAEIVKYDKIPVQLFVPLTRLAKAYGEPKDVSTLFTRQLAVQSKVPVSEQILGVAELLDTMDKIEWGLERFIVEQDRDVVLNRFKTIHGDALKMLDDSKAPMRYKLAAIRVLARGLESDKDDRKSLTALLAPKTPDELQSAAITQLSRTGDAGTPILLLGRWKSYSPALRGQVLDTLFSRAMWTKMTLDMVRQKKVPVQEIDAIRRQRLLQHKDADIREAAAKLFTSASSADRGKIVDTYWLAMPDKGDGQRGAKLFAKTCATCHKLGDMGQNVGPDLASVGDKSPQGLLTAILDPNRAVEARYINYLATTKNGLTFTGILASETSTSITLVGPDGKSHQLLRNELDDLASTGKSLMPEGLEKDLSPQDIADIIEHVRSNQPALKRKEFPGNTPKTVRPGKNGRVHLLPADAAIYGPSLVIEKKYSNLGFWSKPDDRVVWTVELPKEAIFSVWYDFACDTGSAGNTVTIECDTAKLAYKVQSTGSWDTYQLQSIGALRIPAGTHEIIMRSEGPIRGAMIDLKEVELRPR